MHAMAADNDDIDSSNATIKLRLADFSAPISPLPQMQLFMDFLIPLRAPAIIAAPEVLEVKAKKPIRRVRKPKMAVAPKEKQQSLLLARDMEEISENPGRNSKIVDFFPGAMRKKLWYKDLSIHQKHALIGLLETYEWQIDPEGFVLYEGAKVFVTEMIAAFSAPESKRAPRIDQRRDFEQRYPETRWMGNFYGKHTAELMESTRNSGKGRMIDGKALY